MLNLLIHATLATDLEMKNIKCCGQHMAKADGQRPAGPEPAGVWGTESASQSQFREVDVELLGHY